MSNYTQHLKSQKKYTLQLGTIYTNYNSFSLGGSIPHNMARTLVPRQPYSEAVPSSGGRLQKLQTGKFHTSPLFLCLFAIHKIYSKYKVTKSTNSLETIYYSPFLILLRRDIKHRYRNF